MARVLVIDDDSQIRSMLRQMLERIGHEVDEAADGIQGVARFRRTPAELVITDLCMPAQEGIATIRQIVERAPDVQIIALSGGGAGEIDSDPAERLSAAKRSGALRTLRKPIEWDELSEAVDALLRENA